MQHKLITEHNFYTNDISARNTLVVVFVFVNASTALLSDVENEKKKLLLSVYDQLN